MTILFGNLGDGGTIRAFAAISAFTSLGAIAISAEAERYALGHQAVLSLTSIPGAGGSSKFRLNGVDYATTGSLEPEGQRALVVPGNCGDIPER
jgi:hypothetical protein